MIRDVKPEDIPQITELYNYYVLHSEATFEVEPISQTEMERRMKWVLETAPFLVDIEESEHGDILVGFAYVHPWKERKAYFRTYEDTIYLNPDYQGQGRGKTLMTELLKRVDKINQKPNINNQKPIHAIIACITATNKASIAFHEQFGFEKVSHFKEVGTKFNTVLDVVDLELILP